ncbi:hypothetical protein D9757_001136 [Collybiopsis confluens]|uniref:Mitochondrial genome maintenance protein MGM101 n=1 Tax=Collybiopsis confluens TaxID=2823264 RepID=A0A8H5I1C1_9AGAR|nr:hypothetical protein D9757_001136 [Collybiopsis confluens]
MNLASRLLSSTARVAIPRNYRNTLGPSYRLAVSLRPQFTAGYATESPATTKVETEPDAFEGTSSEIPSEILDSSNDGKTDWSRSFHGLSEEAFAKEIADTLLAPVNPLDIEIKPDGMIYLPEIKYRRILNKSFGPGGWGLAPRSNANVSNMVASREYALVCQGRLVAIARGEQEYFDKGGIPTALESAKSNALMRCCKDLGIASELWDPRFIREFKAQHCVEVFAEHLITKKKKKLWRRKDQPKLGYPYQESK